VAAGLVPVGIGPRAVLGRHPDCLPSARRHMPGRRGS
jgi:hypothetical protein